MRLTTKIISGAILSTFLISITLIAGFSFSDRKNYRYSDVNIIDLPQENMTRIELTSFKTILIDEIPFESNNNKGAHLSDKCNIYFDSNPAISGQDILHIPDDLKNFISLNTSDDTLTIKLNMLDLDKKYRNEEHKYLSFSGVNMYLNISNLDIINNIQSLTVNIKNIETDRIKVSSRGNIFIDSCDVMLIDPSLKVNHKRLKITNCNVKRINLDLDNLHNRNIENCNIEEEYYTGTGYNEINFRSSESGSKYWVPKNKNAELHVRFQSDSAKIIIF